MSTEEALLANERSALEGNHFISRVKGRGELKSKKKSGASAIIALVLTIGIFLVFSASSNLLPAAISERLVEETDVQYADAVESKLVVFQQALFSGDIPDDTAEKLSREGVEVGYIDEGVFHKENKSGRKSVLTYAGKTIEAESFPTAVNTDSKLYEIINKATNAAFSRAAYYFDDAAIKVFQRIGTSRNNYNAARDFDKTTDQIVGSGSNISVNSTIMVEKTREENGETITYYEYENLGNNTSSRSGDFISEVAGKSLSSDVSDATMNAANTLNIADTISKEQRSELFFLAYMENISKMKAGEGNQAKVNEVMNKLYEQADTQVVDVNTGQLVTVSGSMVESPSLYAVLTGNTVSAEQVSNYSSDRILKLTENTIGVSSATNNTIHGAITSTNSKIQGSIGRFVGMGGTAASSEQLSVAAPIIDSSLINNSSSTYTGIIGGELIVEGAVNVGRALARASGATAGSAEAAKSYARLTSSVLALDAAVDRRNRSPFDITSRNTFLGSIMYKLATSMRPGSLLTQFANVGRVMGSAFTSLLPSASADDESERFLANFGNCETLNSIGAVGSVTCSEIATFDTSTLDNIYNDDGFIRFVEENTLLDNGVRLVKKDSQLADFINYNNERLTPSGVTDGGILQSIHDESSSITFLSDILGMVEGSLSATDEEKRMARGESFVNSPSNPDWDPTYKYAQRYISLARATDSLRSYSDDETAYTSLRFFEGSENPVIAFLNSQNPIATK